MTADADALGKNLGDDLAEGKATLPLIRAIALSEGATRERLRSALEHGDGNAMPEVLAAIRATGGLDYSRECALAYARAAQQALDGLTDNACTAALRGLARYSVERDR